MRILLDAKDLIEVVEYSRPVDVGTFDHWLRRRDATVVLTATNVHDFVGPVFSAGGDWLEMRALLQKLETLPISYMRELSIIGDELRLALHAYRSGQEPPQINPYVARWDHTLSNDSPEKMTVGLRLDNIVFDMREWIQSYKRYTPLLATILELDRQSIPRECSSLREVFVNAIPERLQRCGIGTEGINPSAFGTWLWSVPSRCLGLRMFYETYDQLRRDKAMAFQDGDFADFAHLTAIPYADFSTVDKRIADLVNKTFLKLRKNDLRSDLSTRVFKKLGDMLIRVPEAAPTLRTPAASTAPP